MALLQIAEPSGTPPPRAHRRAVGIDLGTTNSLVATVRRGIPVVLPDVEGRPLLPSIVHYGESDIAVGYPAHEALVVDPQNTIVSVKRLMGRGLADLSDARLTRAILTGANLAGAKLSGTLMPDGTVHE